MPIALSWDEAGAAFEESRRTPDKERVRGHYLSPDGILILWSWRRGGTWEPAMRARRDEEVAAARRGVDPYPPFETFAAWCDEGLPWREIHDRIEAHRTSVLSALEPDPFGE